MYSPFVSIIMPAYNCEQFIVEAINSVLAQTYPNFELLIADDCSTDGTKEIIDSYNDKRIKRFHNEVNLGYLKASNKLFKLCTGDLITFQDADDFSNPARIEKMVLFLADNEDVSVVGTNVIKVNEQSETLSVSSFPLEYEEIKKAFQNYKVVFTGSALMLRSGVVKKYGIYNEYWDRIGSEDIYWYSLIIQSEKVVNLKEALYYYRTNSNSVTRTHKNPKAFVGHDLIMKMYFRRKQGKKDYIQSGDWKRADTYASFLMELRNVKQRSVKVSKKFCGLMITHPLVTMEFLSEIKNLK